MEEPRGGVRGKKAKTLEGKKRSLKIGSEPVKGYGKSKMSDNAKKRPVVERKSGGKEGTVPNLWGSPPRTG